MTIDYATCPTCNRAFTRKSDEQWKRLCLGCWKASKRNESSTIQALTHQCKTLEHELEVLRGQRGVGQPPAHVLRFLMKAAHPDRNGGSDEANEAMRWILTVRKEARYAAF